jgi:tetratricopeptide (TPR) repeat protein
MVANSNPTIFLSYAWANVDTADSIDKDLESIGIQLKRDIRDLGYRSSIKEFMQQIGKSDFVLMIISAEYLQSVNCMYEVTELLNTHEFEKRILPVIVDNAAHIFKPFGQEFYYDYWLNETKKANKLKRKHANEVTVEFVKKCQNIQDNLPRFFQKTTDLNLATYEKLKSENYRALLNLIGFNNKLLIEETIRINQIVDIEERELELELFLKSNPNDKYALFQKAYQASMGAKFKKAKQYYLDLINLYPDSANAHNNLGITFEALRDFDKAKFHFEQSIAINDDFDSAHYNLGVLLGVNFSDFNKAKFHYERAILINPRNNKAHNNLAILLNSKFSDYDGALLHFDEAIRLDPSHRNAHYNLANLLFYEIKDLEKAKLHYQKAIEIDSKYGKAYANLAQLLDELLDYEGAKVNYEKCIEVSGEDLDARFNLTLLLINHFDDFKGARSNLEKIIELKENDIEAHTILAEILEKHFSDPEQAGFHYQKALKINPNSNSLKRKLRNLIKGV